MKKVLNLKPLGDQLRKETQPYLDGLIRAVEKGMKNKVETESVSVHNPSQEMRDAYNDMKNIIVEYMEKLVIPEEYDFTDFSVTVTTEIENLLREHIPYGMEFLFTMHEPLTDEYLFEFNFYFKDLTENSNFLVLNGSLWKF